MTKETSNEFWNHDAWGDPKDYNVDPIKRTLGGFDVGDRVVLTEDFTLNGMVQGYEDDAGIIVGITQPTAGGGPFDLPPHDAMLSVLLDEYDEPVVIDTDVLVIEP